MINNKILMAVLAVALVLGMTACNSGDGGGSGSPAKSGVDNGGGGSIAGETIVSGATVEYPSAYIKNLADAKKATDFNYTIYDSKPLSNFIKPPASVTVKDGKVTIKLGTPKPNFLFPISSGDIDGVTVDPDGANVSFDDDFVFFTSNLKYVLICGNEGIAANATLAYTDRDVTLKGTRDVGTQIQIWNVSFKKGWNYLIATYNAKTVTLTGATNQSSGFKWTVCEWELIK